MHRGREATYEALSQDFYCPNVAKHVRNWIRRCPSCIKFKCTYPKQGPIQIRIFDGPFATIGTVGQLSTSSLGNKWIHLLPNEEVDNCPTVPIVAKGPSKMRI